MVMREKWGSRLGFIMATAGFSIGLGNILRFPYLTGTNGGGAFVLLYLVFSILIGIPLFTAEISLGGIPPNPKAGCIPKPRVKQSATLGTRTPSAPRTLNGFNNPRIHLPIFLPSPTGRGPG